MNIWDELSKVYNMPGIPDEAMSIIGDVMLAWSESQGAQPEQRSFSRSHEDDLISRQVAIDKFEPWLKVEGYSEGEMNMLKAVLYELRTMPSAQPERTCVNCGRTANNGGWYADGRTRCPIEEHYALPKDGFCHLWEKRNITDDDYPERMEE